MKSFTVSTIAEAEAIVEEMEKEGYFLREINHHGTSSFPHMREMVFERTDEKKSLEEAVASLDT